MPSSSSSSSPTNLVITDEVFIADDDPLVELTFGCDTANVYDSLVRMSNIMSKNAKSSNHLEDIVNNMKLFIETNVGKLTRATSTLDEANRTLQGQVQKLHEELKATREQYLRRDEYDVDIRRLKNQILPCVTFMEDVESKRCYSLDIYIREVLKCDMHSVYLAPFKREIDASSAALMDSANNKTTARLSQQREELQGILEKQTDRVNVELRRIQELLNSATAAHDVSKEQGDATMRTLEMRINTCVDEMRKAAQEQSERFESEMTALDERQKKVVELLGFRESRGGDDVALGSSSAAVFAQAVERAGGSALFTPLSPGKLPPGSSAYGSGVAGQLSPPSDANALSEMFLSMLAASGTDDAAAADDDEEEGRSTTGGDKDSEALSPRSAKAIRGSSASSNLSTSNRSRPVQQVQQAKRPGSSGSSSSPTAAARGGPPHTTTMRSAATGVTGGVRLLARGKSILQSNNPQQGTGLFGTEGFRQFSQLIRADVAASVDEAELRIRSDLELIAERLESMISEKLDKSAVDEMFRDFVPPAVPRDAHLHSQVDALMKQMDAMKRLKSDVQKLTGVVDKKADATALNAKAQTSDLDAMQQDTQRMFQEISASMVQVHQVVRKADAQIKMFHNGLAEHGILMSSYGGGGGGGVQSPSPGGAAGSGATVSGSFASEMSLTHSASQASRLGGDGAKIPIEGFPAVPTGLQAAARKAPLPSSALPGVRASSARAAPTTTTASAGAAGGDIRDVSSAHRSPPPSSANRIHGAAGLPAASSGAGPHTAYPSTTTIVQHSARRVGTPPGLHEVVFEMSASAFDAHKKRSELEKKPIVAPRPPSNK